MRVCVFLDLVNFKNELFSNNISSINLKSLLDYLTSPEENRYFLNGQVFTTIDKNKPYQDNDIYKELMDLGFVINKKQTALSKLPIKTNYEVDFTYKLMNIFYHHSPEIFVILADNQNYEPVINYLKDHGCSVEVASYNPDNSLKTIASSYIDLNLVSSTTENDSELQENSNLESFSSSTTLNKVPDSDSKNDD
jgi:hypothetical protein